MMSEIIMTKLTIDNYNWWNPFTQINFFLKSPVIIEKAEGVYIFDIHNRKYLDVSSSMWNVCLGHNQKEIINTITEQYQKLDFVSPFRASNDVAIRLTDKLASLCPINSAKIFLTCNGSDSVEAGIKIARQYFRLKKMNKYKIISLENSYHGVSYGAMACSGFEEDKQYFLPIPDGFIQIPSPNCYHCAYDSKYPACQLQCASFLETTILKEGTDTVAMFIMEPVMGMGGVIIPPEGYYEIIVDICKKYNILFMLDEVTTGLGRTGKLFAAEIWNLSPDMMALGKALSNGYFPIGATVVTREIWNAFLGDDSVRFNHGSTYFGHPVGCAAALRCIELIEKGNYLIKISELSDFFAQLLKQLREHPLVGDVRSIGMMFAVEFVEDKELKTPLNSEKMKKLVIGCHTQGLWAHFAGNTMLIFPSFIVDRNLLETVYHILLKVLKMIEKR
jgi:adenosylmethionine-8-amino-7-oxononanoate aminotransferase